MRPETIDRFVELIVRSGLATQEQVTELTNQFQTTRQSTKNSTDIAAFCTFLVANDLLTAWQCGKLREGKFKGFFLDDYMLLDRFPHDENFGYYLARDIKDGKLARLTVTPAESNERARDRISCRSFFRIASQSLNLVVENHSSDPALAPAEPRPIHFPICA